MKLLELNLIAFGPFSDCRIDFSEGQPGLHLIYGPNEAGKSSTLLAIDYFLYGFPAQTPVDFKHPYKSLRIGGRLRHSDHRDMNAVRRKANQKSLRCGNDLEPLDDDTLVPFLGDVDRSLFTTMFGINHERLRSGGQEIAQGSGRIGEMLFAAGAGLVDLQHLQNNLLSQMESLLKSSGRSGTIHTDIQEYLLNRKAVDEALVSVDAWNRIEEELRSGRQDKLELDQRIAGEQRELERLQRIKLAGATIDRWQARQESFQKLAHAPRLPEDFANVANQLLMDLRTGEHQVSSTAAELEKVTSQLNALVVPERLMQAAEQIETLRDRIGAIRSALADRTTVDIKRESFEREAKEILRELDRGPDLTIIEELRLPRDKTVKIQSLGNQLERLLERVQAERKNCDKLRREIDVTKERLAATPAAIDVGHMRSLLQTIQQQGDLESELTNAVQKIEQVRGQVTLALRRLPLFTGELPQLEALPVPTAASIDRFEADLAAVDHQLLLLQQQWNEDGQEIETLQSRLCELESIHAIPTLNELECSRQLREQGWQLILNAWVPPGKSKKSLGESEDGHDSESRATKREGRDSESRRTKGEGHDSESRRTKGESTSQKLRIEEFLKNFPAARDLPDAYQQAVIAADTLADALRQDADRVATKAKLQADRDHAEARQSRRQKELEKARGTRKTLETKWRELWQPLGVEPLTPEEMQDWLRKQAALLVQAEHLRELEQHRDQLQQKIDSARQRLLSKLESLERSSDFEKQTLRELLLQMQDKIDAQQATASRHTQLVERLSEDSVELATSETEYLRTEAEVNEVRSLWASEMERLGLEKTALPAQANSRLTSLQSLFEKYREADRYRSRLEHIDRDAAQFTKDVEDLVGQVAPELLGQPFDTAFQSLLGQLEAARVAASQRTDLLQRQKQLQAQQLQLLDQAQRTQVVLGEMVRQAKVKSHDDLAAAAEASRQRQELEQQLAELEDEIVGCSAGAGLAAFVAEVEHEHQAEETISARIAACQQSLQELGEQRDAILGQIKSAEIEEQKFDGSSLAAEKNAVCESIATRLEEELHNLAVLRVAAAVMKEAIERHRQKNQGPILGRASQIFRQITLGQFEGLQAEYSDKGEPVLAGIRATELPTDLLASVGASAAINSDVRTLFDLAETDAEPLAATASGERVLVQGMSDGTCDQLYLALRLASLESWLTHHEPMPFIVDDILMNFDDARSVATLKVLAELSQRTQVIFFTHHQHLVDLAREHLSADDLFVTTLAGSSSSG